MIEFQSIEQVCEEFDAALHNGKPISIEELVEKMGEHQRLELLVALFPLTHMENLTDDQGPPVPKLYALRFLQCFSVHCVDGYKRFRPLRLRGFIAVSTFREYTRLPSQARPKLPTRPKVGMQPPFLPLAKLTPAGRFCGQ